MSLILKSTLVQHDIESKREMLLLYITGSVYFSVLATTLITALVLLTISSHCSCVYFTA